MSPSELLRQHRSLPRFRRECNHQCVQAPLALLDPTSVRCTVAACADVDRPFGVKVAIPTPCPQHLNIYPLDRNQRCQSHPYTKSLLSGVPLSLGLVLHHLIGRPVSPVGARVAACHRGYEGPCVHLPPTPSSFCSSVQQDERSRKWCLVAYAAPLPGEEGRVGPWPFFREPGGAYSPAEREKLWHSHGHGHQWDDCCWHARRLCRCVRLQPGGSVCSWV